MVEQVSVREHTTAAIPMQLLSDNNPIDLTSIFKLRLDLIDNKDKVYRYYTTDVSPAVEVTDAVNGKISFNAPTEDILLYNKQPYRVAVWIWDSPSVRYSVPGQGYAILNLEKEY